MENGAEFYIVDSQALPEIFGKVIFAKRLISQNKVSSCSEAARIAGISRSAYYKYKDKVFVYDSKTSGSITTYYISLLDEPGALSAVISQLYRAGANILTINQNIPVDGVAPVVIAFRGELTVSEKTLRDRIAAVDGVRDIKIMSER